MSIDYKFLVTVRANEILSNRQKSNIAEQLESLTNNVLEQEDIDNNGVGVSEMKETFISVLEKVR